MRISDNERTFIKAFWTANKKNRKIYLFGSRTLDKNKGGDIDILLLGNDHISLDEKMDFLIKFYKLFGEQKVDIVNFTFESNDPFKNIALSTAVEL